MSIEEVPPISVEPMNFVESKRYGVIEHVRVLQEFSLYRHAQASHFYDFLVTSSQSAPIVISPSLMRAASAHQHHLAREEGRPYDAQLLSDVEAETATRQRFLASNWSWLFPRLNNPKIIELRLDHTS